MSLSALLLLLQTLAVLLVKQWNQDGWKFYQIPETGFSFVNGPVKLVSVSTNGWHCSWLRSGLLPSVLWRCWLGGRKGIWPVKTEWWGAGMVICLERGADLHMAQLMPLPLTVCCFSKIQIGFAFLVPAHLGSPGKMAVKWVCVCVVD